MGRKRKRTQNFAKPRLAANRSAQSHTVHLVTSPEKLVKNGDVSKAIDVICTQLIDEPTDERKRQLGECYFQVGDYKEAANVLLTLTAPTANDLTTIGAAWLNEQEWESAKLALQRSLDLEEHAYTLYLQALAIKGGRKYYSLRGEEHTTVIDLLRKARALPDCPADAFLLLDDLLHHHDHTPERTILLEDAILLYPDHTELSLRYARHLTYETRAYAEALIAVAPLLSQTSPSQRALDCAIWSAFKLDLFERALTYANQLRPSSFWPYGPTIDQVKGDIYLAWGKTDEALACYERETQREDFEAAFLSFFRIAKVWLVCNEREKALRAALEGATFWLDYPNDMGCGRVLTRSTVSVGEANDHTYICLYFSDEMVKEICETFLAAEQEIGVDERGRLAYLLYKVYAETEPNDDEAETLSKMDDLLLTVEQGSLHPHMGKDLASHYANKKDMQRATQVHLDYCLWKYSALERHRLRPPAANEENQRLLNIGWTFSEYNAKFSCEQEALDSLSEIERERYHTIAWEALQTHIAETDVVTAIFIPFFHSFWSDLLAVGDMHQAIVETTQLLIQATPDNGSLWWLLAYHLHELEQSDESERSYRHYLELVPDSASALHNLSLIVEEKGVLQEALALSQKAATLSPNDELITQNAQRLNTKHERSQQKQEGATLWSGLRDSQKWLLCLLTLYPSAHWSALLSRIKRDEQQARQLQEDWDWFLIQGICVQPEAEYPVRAVPPLELYIHEEGFQYWLAAEIARVQARKKKNLWLPTAVELGDKQLADLSTTQRGLMQQAFMRQITQVSPAGLEQMYLRFYRHVWKELLIKWEMHRELTDSCEIFLTRLPSVMTRHEMWECAYYATDLSGYTYQNRDHFNKEGWRGLGSRA